MLQRIRTALPHGEHVCPSFSSFRTLRPPPNQDCPSALPNLRLVVILDLENNSDLEADRMVTVVPSGDCDRAVQKHCSLRRVAGKEKELPEVETEEDLAAYLGFDF